MQPCIILQAKFSTEVTVQLLEWHVRRKQHQGPEFSLRLASAASNHLHRSQPLRLRWSGACKCSGPAPICASMMVPA